MTPEQRKRFYFPVWSETAAALDRGCLVADLAGQLVAARGWPEHARGLVTEIIGDAQRLAMALRRAVTAEDLRHACNRAAAGQLSSSRFGQGDVNQFDRLCAVLRDPWDVSATMAWLDPREDDRKRLVHYLKKAADEAVLRSISFNAWQTRDWERQALPRLQWLASQVRERKKYGKSSNANYTNSH